VFCVDDYNNGVFGTWSAGCYYDVVRYDEEDDEWIIKDKSGADGIVASVDFDEYFEKVEGD
jgi:hypothetical protein